MVKGLWGKKIGMTQLFSDNKVVPATVIDVANWFVTQLKTKDVDGYDAVQVGLVKSKYVKDAFSRDWLKKPAKYFSLLREVKVLAEAEGLVVGASVDFYNLLKIGEAVDVFGITKGCGFAGVVKRHGFKGGAKSHGGMMGRRPGSIGNMRTEGRVIKGRKLPGHMGVARRVMQNLEVMRVEAEARLVVVKGSVPGKSGSLVFIQKA